MADNDTRPITDELERNGRAIEEQVLDRDLDLALAKYSAVEPRAGLKDRILANLKAERAHAARGWWCWPRVAALVAMVAIVVAASIAWRWWKPGGNIAAHHASNWVREVPGPQTGSSTGGERVRQQAAVPVRTRRDHGSRGPVVVAAEPRLEQFPSPRPLSDQEKILASYVAKYPEHAILIAQARAEALRRDAAEELETAKRQ